MNHLNEDINIICPIEKHSSFSSRFGKTSIPNKPFRQNQHTEHASDVCVTFKNLLSTEMSHLRTQLQSSGAKEKRLLYKSLIRSPNISGTENGGTHLYKLYVRLM